jgi:hypothetical protein
MKMTEEFAKPGPRIWLCQSAGAAPLFPMQGAAQHTQWQAWGHYV